MSPLALLGSFLISGTPLLRLLLALHQVAIRAGKSRRVVTEGLITLVVTTTASDFFAGLLRRNRAWSALKRASSGYSGWCQPAESEGSRSAGQQKQQQERQNATAESPHPPPGIRSSLKLRKCRVLGVVRRGSVLPLLSTMGVYHPRPARSSRPTRRANRTRRALASWRRPDPRAGLVV